MENEKLKEILKLHKMWLNDEKGGQRANLSDADLSGANLSGADLSGANLRYANLRYANLRGANLRYADLSDADLSGATIPMFCKWMTGIIDNKIRIGCKVKSIEEWEAFLNSDEVIETPRNTPEFKQIEAMIRAYIAYLTTLNK